MKKPDVAVIRENCSQAVLTKLFDTGSFLKTKKKKSILRISLRRAKARSSNILFLLIFSMSAGAGGW